MPPILFPLIKALSIAVITGAIGLEIWHLSGGAAQGRILQFLHPIFWLGRFALVAHLIEASIAAVYASRQQKNPLTYAIYIFFVGTIGLIELFNPDRAVIKPDQS